jgi:hypothetical protein
MLISRTGINNFVILWLDCLDLQVKETTWRQFYRKNMAIRVGIASPLQKSLSMGMRGIHF